MQAPQTVKFAPPPNNHARPYPDIGLDDELKENIKRRIQEVFSSILKSVRQKAVFSREHEARFLDWLHAVVEETYRAEVARERQELRKKDDCRTALLKEKKELTDRLQHIDRILSCLAFSTCLSPSPSNYTGPPRPSGGPSSAAAHTPNPAPDVSSNQPPSRNVQWQEDERRRVREDSNFRAMEEAIHQIESNRQRQWGDWAQHRTTPPPPIVKEQEDILNIITRASVTPPLRNPEPLAPSAIQSNGPLVSDAPDGWGQPHGEGASGKYHSGWEQARNATPTVWPQTPPMESTKYSTCCLRNKCKKTHNECTASPGHTGHGNTVEKSPYERWLPPNMEEAGTAQEAGRGYTYSQPGSAEAKGKWKMSFR